MTFQLFELKDIEAAHASAARLYHEFLRVPAMTAGLYRLAAGATDPQRPHEQDELYVVLSGQGAIEVDGERRPVATGSVLFVPAKAVHRFTVTCDIESDLSLLVIFAPAEA